MQRKWICGSTACNSCCCGSDLSWPWIVHTFCWACDLACSRSWHPKSMWCTSIWTLSSIRTTKLKLRYPRYYYKGDLHQQWWWRRNRWSRIYSGRHITWLSNQVWRTFHHSSQWVRDYFILVDTAYTRHWIYYRQLGRGRLNHTIHNGTSMWLWNRILCKWSYRF